MSIVSKHKVVVQGDIDMSSPLSRITTLENNEYKVTYYEVIQGTSGSLSVPSQGTINSDEFGLSGNAILSKIDANGKPTYQSPTTSLGVAVTTSLDVSTGAWVVSGVYTDPNVAVIYSIRIKAIYYSNLTYNNIIETIDLAVTKTSQLINDGDDGVSHFISLEDLPSNLTLYATNVASDIPTYYKLVTTITDPSYNTTPVNIPTGAITTTGQLIAILATSANVIVGNPGIFNITTIGNIQKLSGTGNAEFYFEVWQRTLAGVETLITVSSSTLPVLNSGYAEFSASALWNNGSFLSTDRIVLKYYADRIVTGSDPTYQFQFGGLSPVRSLVPIPLNVVPVLKLDELQDVTAPTPTNNDVLTYESSTSLWKNKTVTTALGYTPANEDGTILYHSNTFKFFTPTSTVSTSGTTVTITTAQFSSINIGMKLTILGESRIITSYSSTTQVTVASAYSTNYSGVAIADWGVYNKAFQLLNGSISMYYYNSSTSVSVTNDNGLLTANIQGPNFGIYNGESVFANNYTFKISSTTSQFGTKDLGFRRNAAGVFEIYDGITATGLLANRRDLLVRNVNASSVITLAGTTTIAPLKLTAGTNLTTPVNGSFEFDGTNLYFTVGGVRKTVTLI